MRDDFNGVTANLPPAFRSLLVWLEENFLFVFFPLPVWSVGADKNANLPNGVNVYSSSSTLTRVRQQSEQALMSLASQICAFHICQADNSLTCMVPEFVHSLAAQMAHSLHPYK